MLSGVVVNGGSERFQVPYGCSVRTTISVFSARLRGNVRDVLSAPVLTKISNLMKRSGDRTRKRNMFRSVDRKDICYQWVWSTLRFPLLPEVLGKLCFSSSKVRFSAACAAEA